MPTHFLEGNYSMPNHFLVVGLCGRDSERLAAIENEHEKSIDLAELVGVNLCELISSIPYELKGIVASTPRRYRCVHKITGEVWKHDCNGPLSTGSDQWEHVSLIADEVDNLRAKYGAADWYEWQCSQWGTKWGTYGTKVYKMGGDCSPVLIEFQSAWNPPKPAMMRAIDTYLCETYGLANIKWIGHEPYDGTTVDIEIAPKLVQTSQHD